MRERLIGRHTLERLPRGRDLRVRLMQGTVTPEGRLSQDSLLRLQTPNHVAIGVFNGNGEGGNLASTTARLSALNQLARADDEPLTDIAAMDAMHKRLTAAHDSILQQKNDGKIHPVATSSATVVDFFRGAGGQLRAVVGNVGKSRAYYFKGDTLRKISNDTDQEIGEPGGIFTPEVTVTGVPEGSRIVVLTGEPDQISADAIKDALKERSLRKAKERLLAERADDDDLSVVIADVKKHHHVARKALAIAAAGALIAGAAIKGPELIKDYNELQHAQQIISQLQVPSASASPGPTGSSPAEGGTPLPPSFPAPVSSSPERKPKSVLTLPEFITQGEQAGVIVKKTIHPGDNYWEIVEKQLGKECGVFPVWKLDLALNNDKDPNLIYPNQHKLFIAQPYAELLSNIPTDDLKSLPHGVQKAFADLLKPAATSQIAKEQGRQVLGELLKAYNITTAIDFEKAIKELSSLSHKSLDAHVSGKTEADTIVTAAAFQQESAPYDTTIAVSQAHLTSDVQTGPVFPSVPTVESTTAVQIAPKPVVTEEKRSSHIRHYRSPAPMTEGTVYRRPERVPVGAAQKVKEAPQVAIKDEQSMQPLHEPVELMSEQETMIQPEDTSSVLEMVKQEVSEADHTVLPIVESSIQTTRYELGATPEGVILTGRKKIRIRDFLKNPIKMTKAVINNWRLKRINKRQSLAYAVS